MLRGKPKNQQIRSHFMNLRADHTATLIGPRSIHLTVVLVAVPIWQVLADLGPSRQHAAEKTSFEQSLDALQAGVVAIVVAHVKQQPLRPNQAIQLGNAREVASQWFLHEDGDTGTGTGQGDWHMQSVWVANERCIRFAGKSLFQAGVDGNGVITFQISALFDAPFA